MIFLESATWGAYGAGVFDDRLDLLSRLPGATAFLETPSRSLFFYSAKNFFIFL